MLVTPIRPLRITHRLRQRSSLGIPLARDHGTTRRHIARDINPQTGRGRALGTSAWRFAWKIRSNDHTARVGESRWRLCIGKCVGVPRAETDAAPCSRCFRCLLLVCIVWCIFHCIRVVCELLRLVCLGCFGLDGILDDLDGCGRRFGIQNREMGVGRAPDLKTFSQYRGRRVDFLRRCLPPQTR